MFVVSMRQHDAGSGGGLPHPQTEFAFLAAIDASSGGGLLHLRLLCSRRLRGNAEPRGIILVQTRRWWEVALPGQRSKR